VRQGSIWATRSIATKEAQMGQGGPISCVQSRISQRKTAFYQAPALGFRNKGFDERRERGVGLVANSD